MNLNVLQYFNTGAMLFLKSPTFFLSEFLKSLEIGSFFFPLLVMLSIKSSDQTKFSKYESKEQLDMVR